MSEAMNQAGVTADARPGEGVVTQMPTTNGTAESPQPYQRQVLIREVGPDDIGRLLEVVDKVRTEGQEKASDAGLQPHQIDLIAILSRSWGSAQEELYSFLAPLAGTTPGEMPKKLSFLGKAMQDLEEDEELNAFLPPLMSLLTKLSGGQRVGG